MIPQTHPAADCSAMRQAQAARAELEALTDRWSSRDKDDPQHIHSLFSELYLCTTEHWLRLLAGGTHSQSSYQTIAVFYGLYKQRVVDRLDAPLQDIEPHWRLYHRLARRLTIRSPITLHLMLVSLGVRAHTLYDLGEALLDTERRGGFASVRDLSMHRRFFEETSNAAFLAASAEFIDRHLSRQTGWRRWVLSVYRIGLFKLRPVWLGTLQHWRRSGYKRARGLPGPRILEAATSRSVDRRLEPGPGSEHSRSARKPSHPINLL